MTYNTNNQVPSVDVRDLYDNAQNLDNLVNGDAPAYPDRLDVSRKSYKGMELDFSAFLAASGFELPAIEYVDGSPFVVDRPTQLISRDGILYSVKAIESFPATLTGTFAADQARLVVRTDSDLRQDLANTSDPEKGVGLSGFTPTRLASSFLGSAADAIESALGARVSLYGAIGDGVADDTPAINALVKKLAILGGGQVTFEPGRTYFLAGKVLLPSNVRLDLCGATLKGPGSTTGIMFESAYLSGGELVSNIGAAPETQLVRHASVKNGNIKDVGLVFNLFNFVMGSSLRQLSITNCRQVWKMERCFYPTIEDIYAAGGSDPAFPCYHFKDQTNAIVLTRVSATMEFGYYVEGGCTAFTLNGCTFEGGAKGFAFTGDCLGVSINGGYFEAVPGTLFDLKGVGTGSFDFKGNYINFVDVVLDDGASATGGPTLFGGWSSSNYLANIGGVTGGVTYRGRMVVSAIKNHIEFKLQADGQADQSIPANWLISANTDIYKLTAKTGLSAGDFRQKSIYSGTAVIPMRRGGDVGPALNGYVFFSDVASSVGSVTVDTKINYRPNSLFAKFTFTLQDENGIQQVFGDIYGANVDKRSSSPITVVASDNAGMLRLTLGITGSLLSLTGSVQIC